MDRTMHIRTISRMGFAAQGIAPLCAGMPGFVLTASAQAGDVTPQ
jgi:hypothetical protein